MDPLAEEFYAWSSYNYVYNNPILMIDPDGRFGDYYKQDGTYLGSDGIDDSKVYVVENTINEVETAQVVKDIGTGDVQEVSLAHEEFQQFGANVYNEAPYESSDERDKVASAIVNRKETSSQGGTWERTLNKIMFNKDSHDKKMSPGRANPKKGTKVEGTNIQMTNVATENYQDFYRATPAQRNKKVYEQHQSQKMED